MQEAEIGHGCWKHLTLWPRWSGTPGWKLIPKQRNNWVSNRVRWWNLKRMKVKCNWGFGLITELQIIRLQYPREWDGTFFFQLIRQAGGAINWFRSWNQKAMWRSNPEKSALTHYQSFPGKKTICRVIFASKGRLNRLEALVKWQTWSQWMDTIAMI